MKSPLYRLNREVDERPLVTCDAIVGFFVGGARSQSTEPVRLVRVGESCGADSVVVDDAELCVLSEGGHTIGRYYIGHVVLMGALSTADPSQLAADFGGYCAPYPLAENIWRTWAAAPPVAVGTWAELPVSVHEDWLHVAQNAWFTAGHRAACEYRDGYFEARLPGGSILSSSSLYCALGEAFNGPGGYFGSTPDGFRDCLHHSVSVTSSRLRFEWPNFAVAEENVEYDELEFVVSALRESGVEVLC